MENFATYILNEQDPIQKMNIARLMAKRTGIFFDKSIILRTEIGRMFLNHADLGVDKNEILTELLLCNCKKVDNPQKIGKLETYAKEGAEYLSTLGFSEKFCHTCEGLNRYIPAEPREKESDILEVIDQFSGLILRRAEREAFTPKEALVILQERNLKHVDNKYLEDFISFVEEMENLYIKDSVEVPVIRKLAFLCEKEKDVKSYISRLSERYSEEIDHLMGVDSKESILENNTENKMEKTKNTVQTIHRYTRKIQKSNSEKSLFSKEVADRVLSHQSEYRIEEEQER